MPDPAIFDVTFSGLAYGVLLASPAEGSRMQLKCSKCSKPIPRRLVRESQQLRDTSDVTLCSSGSRLSAARCSNGPVPYRLTDRRDTMHLILFVLIGLIAGALAGQVVSGHGYGLLGDLIVGVVGAFLGGWLFAVVFGVAGGSFVVSLLTAFVGAVILLWALRLIAPSRA